MNSTSDAPALSVVLPTYNERENILLMMREIVRLLADLSFEIIVVDDNSPDGTWQVVEEFAREHPQVRLLRRMNARGLTSAYNDGIKHARGRLVMWMDVDFSMSPERIPEMLRAIDEGADVAVGSRYISGGGDIRGSGMQLTTQLILSKIITIFCSLTLGCRCSDWTSGYIMIKREILEGYELYGDHGEYFIGLMYYLIKQRRAKITEIPYVLTPRRWGESKTATNLLGLYRRGTRYLHVIWRLRFGGTKG
ncbi:MAG TPA: polyprenol monophosphomannose synthase [Gammaproteobacteria bacterium]|jgi:dolichol-phosphate mannosyltransferase